ncbi:DUF1764-domain-containing protein [Neoconidiobolus thromboides FSU 785]|nr:DUF1764-domain-containing protein [Neoconidiobolus thromboides FSU 785]
MAQLNKKLKSKGNKQNTKNNLEKIDKSSITKNINSKDNDKFIDDLFSKKKSTKPKVDKIVFQEKNTLNSKQKPIINEEDDFFDSRGTKGKRKLTEEGYPIFDLKELKIGEGEGDTPLCPFDCKCCY